MGYLKSLAAEVAPSGVTVNALLPGRIATKRTLALDLTKANRTGVSVEQIVADSQSTIPVGRYGTLSEFGAAAAFLCSAPASYVTGVALRCDGGMVKSL
jgi:3-oxoacyl-[acyl-carrier protein] reductase